MLKLIVFLKDFKKQVIIGPIFKLIEAIFELIVPIIMARIIDVGIKNKDIYYVLKMGSLILFLGIVGLACALICQRYAAIASQGFGTTVRNKLFSHINSLSHAEVDKFGTPSLITRIINDVNQLQFAVAMLIRLVIRAPFLAIGAMIMAMILDWKLSLVFLVTIPLIVLTLYLIMSRCIPYYRLIQKKLDRISLITRENLEGVRVIRGFSKQQNEEKRFNEANKDLIQTSIRVGKLSTLLNPLTYIIMNFAIIAIIWFGGIRVSIGSMTQGQIIAFANYISQILLALIVVANLVVVFTKASASALRVNEVLETKPSVIEYKKDYFDILQKSINPKIEFRNVSFSYNNSNEYAVKNIDLKIYSGETIGIIGGTGSGKSTMISLIPRFYDVSKGEVIVDGKNVKDFSFKQLRKEVGIVPQNPVLFTGTIDENIKYGNEDASEEDVYKALKISQSLDFVSKLPEKNHFKVSQGGKNLSGGQKQRLTIARAIVSSPNILILDDSTSALDYSTDAALRLAIKKETENTTVIIVSQRVNSIKDVAKIIVLDNGEIVGLGNYDELIKTCEVFKEICISQQSLEVDRDEKISTN